MEKALEFMIPLAEAYVRGEYDPITIKMAKQKKLSEWVAQKLATKPIVRKGKEASASQEAANASGEEAEEAPATKKGPKPAAKKNANTPKAPDQQPKKGRQAASSQVCKFFMQAPPLQDSVDTWTTVGIPLLSDSE